MLKIVKHLERLGVSDETPNDVTEDVFFDIKEKFGPDMMLSIIPLCEGWSKFTGDFMFPVPCPDGTPPSIRYNKTRDLWRGSYGALQRDLCLYLAERISKLYV